MKRALLLVGGLVAALVARGDSATPEIAQSEAQADYIRFESRAWAADVHGEGGRLAANTVWTGEHVIVSDVYVPSGVTLTLAPGATIRFCEGTRIKVEDGGSLILNDAADGEIVLTGLAADTAFVGITLQSDSATFRDNGHVVAGGFAFDAFATVSLRDTTAFLAGGLARVPVTVSGSRTRAFSFDWVAETNGVAFASGTMRWDKVGDGTKDILIPFGPELAALDSFTVRASCLRCCTASRATSVVTLSAFVTVDVQTAEAWGNFVRFESRDWAADFADVANAEGGRLATNAVWSGEHVILNDVYVPSGVTLTLTADTRVRFCEGTMIKVEDGGTLRIIGADGHDVILCGYAEGTAYRGIDKMPSGTLADNGYMRVDSLAFASLARVALNNSDTFRTSGLALVPVTVSGSRDGPFSIDWVAETNGVAYKSGTLAWARASEGTKTISIGYGAELDGLDRFAVRVAVHRACFAKPDVCEVKIRDFAVADIQMAEARSAFIRFESRDWATNFVDVANAEGGRLTTNAVWSGEHVILNDVYIPSGVTLTLTADAVVRFCEGTMIKIEDGGVLNVIGAEGHDVILCDYDEETTSRGLVKMSAGTYADNMYVQYPDFRYGNYPDLTLHDAGIGRDAGKVYVPVTVSGASRSQPFNVDWETDKGASGTVAWKQSGDGTKWIEIPVDATPFGGVETYGIRLTAARGANLAVADATVTIYEFNHPVTESVSFSAGAETSAAFAVNGEIKRQPIFLNAAEELRYSGRWQSRLAPEDVFSRISVESDNGSVRLGEWPGMEEGTWTLDLADYKVGHYTLRHEILSSETRKVVDAVTKSFSIVDPDDVVLHGGTLTQSETWKAGKTHVVFETVVVPSAYTLFIEPGAIVKFMSGTGIDISQGGAFFANAIVFTHINDDTVGGDTLSDGYTVAPSMDSYFLSGNFTFGSDTEIRYITQPRALAGTISDRRILSRGSTYRVSGTVTIANGASLTIPAGTVLKLADKAAIVVNSGGALFAQGTRSAPITITTVNDDSISGKTDGSNSNPQPGDWDEICNNGGTIEMSNVTLRYGGYGQYSNQGDAVVRTRSGTTRLEGCVVAHTNLRLLGCTGGRMTAVNCVLMDGWWGIDGAVGLVNGVISKCLVGSNGGSVTNTVYYNCGTYSSGSKVGHCVAYGDVTTVQSGMTYADPLFVDPNAGDFRVVEGSPCVDAADSSVAPERDFYGQPRLTLTAQAVSAPIAQTNGVSGAQTNDTPVVQVQLADIGICEVMPRNVTSGIDLEARSVRGETNAVPGKMLFVKWEVRNVGGAEVDQPWRDTISLVSADGAQEVTLGDKETASLISEGGIAFCSGYFTVPALAEGTWYPKVNVNSYRDIFEGVLTTNNVLIGETAIRVESEAIDARVGCDGLIVGGMPEILKLAFDDEDENRMVRLSVPKGVTVRWGFDFMPSATRSSGSAVSDGSDILFRVPEDVSTVYLSLESDGDATYEVSAESGKVAITSVSPNTLPSSGEVTITIGGAGFTADSTVVLSRGGVEIAPESVQYVSAQQLVVTVDCAKLAAGAQYDVSVVGAENVATLATAVSVAAIEGKSQFWAKLVVPDAVRQGRRSNCYVEFGNNGNADSLPRILQVSAGQGCSVIYADSDELLPSVHYIAASTISGRIAAGDVRRIPFEFVAGSKPEVILYVDEESDGELLARAVSVVADRNADFTDYRLVFNELDPSSAIGSETYREYCSCLSDGPERRAVKIWLSGTSEKIMSISARNIKTGETYMARLGEGGGSEFWDLPAGTYRFEALAENSMGSVCAHVVPDGGDVSITLRPSYEVSGVVLGAAPDDVVVFSSAENSYYGCVGKEGSYSCVVPAGQYDVFVITSTEKLFEEIQEVAVDGEMTLDLNEKEVPKTQDSPLRIALSRVATKTEYNDSFFENKYTQARKRINEGIRLLALAGQIKKPTGEYDCSHNREIYYDNYRTFELFHYRLNAFMNNVRMSDPYKALALVGKSVHDTARAYLDIWMTKKADLATRCYGKWIGGIFNAKNALIKYVYVKGLDAIEAQIGSFESDVNALQYRIEHRECSLEYVEQVLDAIAVVGSGVSNVENAFDVLRNSGVVLSSEIDALETGVVGDIPSYISLAASIAEVISDWLKTGEATGEWVAGRVHIDKWIDDFEEVLRNFASKLPLRPYLQHCCPTKEGEDIAGDNVADQKRPLQPTSIDPNEMGGIMGRGDEGTQRYVKPGEWMTYTVYFENKSTATAAAQEVKVTNPLSRYLDWSTFEMGEVAFNNQVDLGLNGQQNGTSEVTMNGTSYRVRSKVTLDKADGQVAWYLRIVDPSTATTWPDDVFAGFLPPNDETFRGEGHLTYRIKVRDDAPAGVKITNAASIVFDYNDPIETDPAWWNQVAKVVSVEGLDGKSVNVSVDPAWIKAHVGASATDAEIAAALNAVGKNGLKVWMSAALGLDPENPDDTFRVDVPQNADANVVAAKILGGDQPETNAWMAIQYRLDRDASGGGAAQPGVAQSGRAFGIDVGGAADPTGVYQVKAVFSDDEGTATTEVPAANQIGVLRTAAASAREIVPVPWTKFASEVTDIAVSNLVKTAGLSAGDRLFAYDESAKRYATWELRPDKTWKPLKTIKLVDGRLEAQEAESPEVATVKRGSGVWLERQDTAKPIVLVGQHEAASAVTAINGGTSDRPKWNLLATPAISNWNLNAICEGVDVKDRIIVPTGKEPRIYTRDDANAKWGYMGYEANDKGIVKPVRKEDDTMLAPGTGFWYISEGGAPVITW